jgi:hypothetical protein
MENLTTPPTTESLLVIDESNKAFLIESSKWGKFLAIVGYVFMGLLALMGLFFMIGMSVMKSLTDIPFNPGFFNIIYIIMTIIYYFPVTYLYNFSNKIKQGIMNLNQQAMTDGFGNLKSMFKFMGILTIVMLSIYALVLVIAVPIAIIAAAAA